LVVDEVDDTGSVVRLRARTTASDYSNGPIEGTNTKFKLLKRQMYGRAGFALMRQRILLS
jgi:transposase